MKWISGFVSRYWRDVHFLTVVVLSIILIVGVPQVNQHVSQGMLLVFYQPFASVKIIIEELAGVAEENDQLRQTLVETSVRLADLEEMKRENIRLRSILGFEPPPGYRLLPAEVISVSGQLSPQSAVINRGTSDTVSINQTLINRQGLVGRISDVMPDYATVQLLSDPTNRVAVRVADTASRHMGIAKFTPGGEMVLDNFPIQGVVAQGDTIISSGLGGIYPEGLFVAVVEDVVRREDEPFADIKLRPAADFNSLEEIFILRPVRE